MGIKIAIIGLIITIAILGLFGHFQFSKSISKTQNQAVSQNQFQNTQIIKNPLLGNPLQFVTSSPLLGAKKSVKEIGETLAPDNSYIAPSIITSSSISFSHILQSQIVSQKIVSQKMPNDIETMIVEMKRIGVQQGRSQEDLVIAEDAIRQTAATTTDLMAEFLKIANANAKIGFGGFFEKILSNFNFIKIAEAGIGVPFGGRVIAVIPCTCTGGAIWAVVFTPPLPPSYATFLSYAVGTQLFLSHVPAHPSQSFLGTYWPGVQACSMAHHGCFILPNEGLISPQVGSSL